MTFIEVLKAQCEYSNAKAQREQADREVTLAAEKKKYILTALEKATKSLELCKQKAEEATAATEVAQRNQEDAVKRFEAAEIALSSAVSAYQSSIAPEVTTTVADDAGMQHDTVGEALSVETSSEQVRVVDEASETADFDEPFVSTETSINGAVVSEAPADKMVSPSPDEDNGAESQKAFE